MNEYFGWDVTGLVDTIYMWGMLYIAFVAIIQFARGALKMEIKDGKLALYERQADGSMKREI